MNVAREARWFLVNYVLLNAYAFVLSALVGVVLLTSSPDRSISGWSGSPIEQVFWYAVGSMFFLTVVYGVPVLLAALVAWGVAILCLGHPRLTAYLVAGVLVLAIAFGTERAEPLYLALTLIAALGFATIVRLPHGSARSTVELASEP